MELERLKIALSQAEQKESDLEERLNAAHTEVMAIRKGIWLIENNFHIGQDVYLVESGKETKGRLTGLESKYGGIRPIFQAFKKDGTLSIRTPYIYHSSTLKPA